MPEVEEWTPDSIKWTTTRYYRLGPDGVFTLVPEESPRPCKAHGIAWCHEEIHALVEKFRGLESQLRSMQSQIIDIRLGLRE